MVEQLSVWGGVREEQRTAWVLENFPHRARDRLRHERNNARYHPYAALPPHQVRLARQLPRHSMVAAMVAAEMTMEWTGVVAFREPAI